MLLPFINVQYCYNYLIDQIPVALLLYSHIPTSLVSLFLGVFILYKEKNRQSFILFLITFLFTAWCFLDLISWFFFVGSSKVMSAWSPLDLISLVIFFLAYYFLYTYTTKKDLPLWQWLFSILIILPTAISTFIGSNLIYYDSNSCTAIEDGKITGLLFIASAIFTISSIILSVFQYKKCKDDNKKKEILLISIGIIIFLVFFFSALLLVSLFSDSGASDYVYNYQIYGLFGMPLLVLFLLYTIIKFKAFDIKLLGVQALVWAQIVLISSQFLFIQNNVNKILTAITLVISSIVGLIIVRSVKKEVSLRESLEVANKGQENLIHIMNHQIKGFFGIARNIFAELLGSEDYGHMPEESKPLLEKGLQSTSAGVDYVQDILKGSSAEKGTLPYDMKPMDVKVMVLSVLDEQKDIAIKKGLLFESNVNEGKYDIIGDAVQLKEAFKNLITNAIKYNDYNDPNRGIKVKLECKGNKIIFSVKDTGVGISEEDKPRLFTAGGMGKNSMKLNVEASGFGLAFVKGVAEKHNGTVGFRPNKPEKGTTFYIELPATKISLK